MCPDVMSFRARKHGASASGRDFGALTPRAEAEASDPIDELIASLAESISAEHGAQPAGVDPDVRGVRIATTPPEAPRRRRRLTVHRRHRPSRRMRQAFSFIAIALLSIAVGFLVVYFTSP